VKRHRALLVAALLAGCASNPASAPEQQGAERFVGLYEGSFASALSPQPEDDLNFNDCDEQHADCNTQYNPLVDIILKLDTAPDGRLRAGFYWHPDDAEPMDLLGRGCGSRIGPLDSLTRDSSEPNQVYTARFLLEIDNRLCAGRLRPTSKHFMLVRLYDDPAAGRSAEVLIDKAVVSRNYLYVEEKGVRRRVRIDVDNTPENARRGGYRVCIEDDEGEYSRCVITDKELKQFALPLPVPGGVAANYTWWYDLSPNLKRTHGLYELEQYVGRFDAFGG